MKNNFFIDNNIRISPKITKPVSSQKDTKERCNFAEVLGKELNAKEEIKFSRHALERMDHRKIQLSSGKMEKLNQAIQKAEAKGSKESLILIDDLAFVVSIKNKTVITAVDGSSLKENVFTNIDSAVII